MTLCLKCYFHNDNEMLNHVTYNEINFGSSMAKNMEAEINPSKDLYKHSMGNRIWKSNIQQIS